MTASEICKLIVEIKSYREKVRRSSSDINSTDGSIRG